MKKLLLVLLLPLVMCAQHHASDESKQKAKKELELLRQRVIRGESFGSIAAIYSEDPGSAKNGGIYKNVVKGQMVKEFEDVAFSLKPGDISEVFETQYGFHFIQLIARRGDEVDLRHILIMPK
jgi:peptidyl-prolyl cis-trans isomerase SurA